MRTTSRSIVILAAALVFTSAAVAAQTPAAAPAAPPAAAPAAAPTAAPAPIYVVLQTSMGDILLQLDPARAPISVENFMKYVKRGFYDGTTFHRVVPNFVVQGGGFDSNFVQKPTDPPIKNEWTNGLKNTEGSISMARLPSPDSATTQFFLNLKANPGLDGANGPGYAVFGSIVDGMDVMHAIGQTPTSTREVATANGGKNVLPDSPVQVITINKAIELSADDAMARIAAKKAAAAAEPVAPAAPAAPMKPAPPAVPGKPSVPSSPATPTPK